MMKKILISMLTLTVLFKTAPAQSECIGLDCPPDIGPVTRMQNAISDTWYDFKSKDIWKPDNEKYWLNKFRNYQKYPVTFYSEDDLMAAAGEDNVRTVEVHEYQRYTPVSAFKGQIMYDSATYDIVYRRGSGERYAVDRDTMVYLHADGVKIGPNTPLKPIGEVRINGEYFMLLELPRSSYVLAVDNHGNIAPMFGQVNNRGYYLVGRDRIHIKPANAVIKSYSDSVEKTTKPVFNFSITYGGIENKEIALVIKDGTGEEQTRMIPMWKKMITVNGVKIQIIYANPEYIEYQLVY
ncbi:MAG: hypothetical protein IJ770_01230 [Alphaproteobacteria bacterium]|nr:hypothetical protein [Alphaproteobacteria bacterium]